MSLDQGVSAIWFCKHLAVSLYKIPRLVRPHSTTFVRKGIFRLAKKSIGRVESSKETADAQAGFGKQPQQCLSSGED